MNSKFFSEWLDDIDAKIKKNCRQILPFIDNCPCHPVDIQLSNVKIVFSQADAANIVQPLDQGVIHSFKHHYRQMLVKLINAQCATICSVDQITVMTLEAILWMGVTCNKATDTTIRYYFRVGDFSHTLSDQQTFQNEVLSMNEGSNQDPIKQLDDLRSHIRIDGNQLSAVDLVDIDPNIPVFNEWNRNRDLLIEIVSIDHTEDRKKE